MMKNVRYFLSRPLHWWVLILSLALVVRILGLQSVPPAPYWEEVALGYDAWSILQTGRDHHGSFLPLIAFESFGDYKPSLFFYYLVPFLAVFGLETWVVRLASVAIGFVSVVILGLLFEKVVTSHLKKPSWWRVLGSAVLALAPWHIMMSRTAFEAHLAMTLLAGGVLLWLIGLGNVKHKLPWLMSSVFLIVVSSYAYHSHRVVAPLLLIVLTVYWWLQSGSFLQGFLIKHTRTLVVLVLTSIVLMLPQLWYLATLPEASIRFAQTSFTTDLAPILASNQAIESCGGGWYCKILFHRYWYFGHIWLQNLSTYFSLDFWLISGDSNWRHHHRLWGMIYPFEVLGLLAGVWYMLTEKRSQGFFILGWLLVAFLPASLTKTNPHGLRILAGLPALFLVISFGWKYILNIISTRFQTKSLLFYNGIFGLVLLYGLFFVVWYRHYWLVYPQLSAQDWQVGYAEVMTQLYELNQDTAASIPVIISREYGRPAMYYFFYNQIDPQSVQAKSATATKDQSEILEYENTKFRDDLLGGISAPLTIVAASPGKVTTLVDAGLQVTPISEVSKFGTVWWQIVEVRK